MRSVVRQWLGCAAFAVLLALLLLGLRALAARTVAMHLHEVANRELALIEHDQPLWRWPLRRPHDLVAARAFGTADVQADHGLRFSSRDGTPFEIGLPVHDMLDPQHWPLLALHGAADMPFRLGVGWQPRLGEPDCFAWRETSVAAGPVQLVLDLRRLHWQTADGKPCSAPVRIEVLRLKLLLPARAALRLDEVALRRDAPLPVPSRPTLQLSADPPTAARQLADPSLPAAPWIALPAGAAAEAQLALREMIWRWRPGALILLQGDSPIPAHGISQNALLSWIGALGYLLGLAILALYPSRSSKRPWLEVLACLAGPLWLIAGLHLGLRLSIRSLLVFVGAVLFAAQAEWRQRPVNWRWSGNWRAWLIPLVPLAVVFGLIALFGSPLVAPKPGHALMYLSWALLQQWLMLAVLLRRLEDARLPALGAVLLTALVFALMHVPNGALMQLCLLAELWWAWCFRRARALLPVAVAHALCALLLEAGLAGGLLRSLEVSARFFL